VSLGAKVGATLIAAVLVSLLAVRASREASCALAGLPLVSCDATAGRYAAMRRDLAALKRLEEAYVDEHWTYTYVAADLGFSQSAGVSVMISATQKGWAATATHADLDEGLGCAVYWEDGASFRPRLLEGREVDPGEIYCTD